MQIATFFPLSDPERIGALLIDSVFEAHTRTSLMPREQIREEWTKGIDRAKLFSFKNMVSISKALI